MRGLDKRERKKEEKRELSRYFKLYSNQLNRSDSQLGIKPRISYSHEYVHLPGTQAVKNKNTTCT